MDYEWWGYGYGSIPINTIFRGMNIHLPAILMFTRGTRFWHTAIWSKGNGTISSKDTFFAQRMMSEAMDHRQSLGTLPSWVFWLCVKHWGANGPTEFKFCLICDDVCISSSSRGGSLWRTFFMLTHPQNLLIECPTNLRKNAKVWGPRKLDPALGFGVGASEDPGSMTCWSPRASNVGDLGRPCCRAMPKKTSWVIIWKRTICR